ncbi:MAG: hypothetical protein AAB916_02105 [Patescibacteria group bacterium]
MHSQSFGQGRWREYTFDEQMGNIGSEISRAHNQQDHDEQAYNLAVALALQLVDFTLDDPRWEDERRKEIIDARERIYDAFTGGKKYGTTWEELDEHFLTFAVAARKSR